jgi:hypothetical protein
MLRRENDTLRHKYGISYSRMDCNLLSAAPGASVDAAGFPTG